MSIRNKADELEIQKKKIRKNNIKKIMATTLASSIVLQSTTNVFADELIFKDNELSNINVEVKGDTKDKEVIDKEHTTNVNSKNDNEINNEEKEIEIKEETNYNKAIEKENNNTVNYKDKNETNSEEKEVEVKEEGKNNKSIEKENTNTTSSKKEKSNDNEVAYIPDPNLKAALNEELGNEPDSDITKEELKTVTSLAAPARNITDLNGLQYCTNIDYLDLARNQISDISPLSGLTKLFELYLENNQISDISPLSGMINLDVLLIENNQISDISPLSSLTALTQLFLDNNQISDISPLSGLKNLWTIDLNDNQISDISPLSELKNLVLLEIQNNQISDLSPLSNLKDLEDLYAGNQIIYANEIKVDSESVEIKNEIKSVDGSIVQPNKISDGGVYNSDTNLIKWDNINSDCSRTYNFYTRVLDPNTNYNVFSGKVIQPIKYSNDKPIISGADNISIKEGSTFDPMAGVTATDTEDGDITNKIEITGTVNTNKPGKYELTYTVKDETGNIVTVKRLVTVNPKMESINSVPIITVEDKVLTVGDEFNPLDGVTATDKEDGDITLTEENIISNNVDMKQAGTYNVTYKVTDKKGASSVKTITVVVNPKMETINSIPTITAENKVLTVGDKFNPLDGVTANDKEDGDIILTEKNIISNSVDMSKAGTYNITYKVTDSKGASSIKTITVVVNPKMEAINSVPTITVEDKVLTVGDKFDPLDEVTAYDEEDGDITKNIEIIKDTVNMRQAGTYSITYKVTDKKGASAIKTITIVVNPKMELINLIPIITAEDKVLTVGDEFNPLYGVTAYDEEDGDITKNIEIIKDTVNTRQAGTYTITYKVTDSKGASTIKTITIEVINNDTGNEPENPEEENNNNSNNNLVNEPEDLQEDNQSIVDNNTPINSNTNINNNTSIPETGDTGVLGSAWLGFTALIGLIFNNRKKKK